LASLSMSSRLSSNDQASHPPGARREVHHAPHRRNQSPSHSVCSSCCRSSAPWCRSCLSRSSSARSGSWTTFCSCDDHLRLHCCLSSRWSTRN
jgi:hypothetical protein